MLDFFDMAGTPPDGDNAPRQLAPPPPSHSVHSAQAKTAHAPSPLAHAAAKIPQLWVGPLCGSLSGVASGIVTCPLDVIKTKLQAQGSFRQQNPSSVAVYRGLVGTASTIIRHDGIRGMYRGLAPMLYGYIPTWAVYMGVYDQSKRRLAHVFEEKWKGHILSAVIAGACSTTTTNPIWVIKTRLMSQSTGHAHRTPWQYANTLDAARQMYRSEGLRAFYSGLAPALFGLTHVAIQFPLYESLKFQFTGLEMGQETDSTASNNFGMFAATCLSKIAATTATYPHEVLRTRLQTQQRGTASSDGMINKPRYQGVFAMIKNIVREEGWRAFYSGLGTNMIRAVPAAVTTMFTYETLYTTIIKLQKDAGIDPPSKDRDRVEERDKD